MKYVSASSEYLSIQEKSQVSEWKEGINIFIGFLLLKEWNQLQKWNRNFQW